jgi:hypothetical protein
MKQLIEDLISAMEYHVEQTRPVHMTTVAIQAAKDALKAMPAPQPVPVKTYHDGKPWPVAPKPWVGLTDVEVMQTMSGDWTSQFYFARAIEAKLKEKNT